MAPANPQQKLLTELKRLTEELEEPKRLWQAKLEISGRPLWMMRTVLRIRNAAPGLWVWVFFFRVTQMHERQVELETGYLCTVPPPLCKTIYNDIKQCKMISNDEACIAPDAVLTPVTYLTDRNTWLASSVAARLADHTAALEIGRQKLQQEVPLRDSMDGTKVFGEAKTAPCAPSKAEKGLEKCETWRMVRVGVKVRCPRLIKSDSSRSRLWHRTIRYRIICPPETFPVWTCHLPWQAESDSDEDYWGNFADEPLEQKPLPEPGNSFQRFWDWIVMIQWWYVMIVMGIKSGNVIQ